MLICDLKCVFVFTVIHLNELIQHITFVFVFWCMILFLNLDFLSPVFPTWIINIIFPDCAAAQVFKK